MFVLHELVLIKEQADVEIGVCLLFLGIIFAGLSAELYVHCHIRSVATGCSNPGRFSKLKDGNNKKKKKNGKNRES